jgi:phosphoribosyl-ATP pyrophosphohydrolase/phosphoribosyl-AMP cyclohydrolase
MTLDFAKQGGLVPAIVQDADTNRVLMLGYMDEAALEATRATSRVTFFSRRRGALWTKGETSGNALVLVSIDADCDRDALLIRARPLGPTCHTGARSCFGEVPGGAFDALDAVIAQRATVSPEESYTARLLQSGVARMAQKVGEEGVETALAAMGDREEAVVEEAADLLFHLAVLLHAKGKSLRDVQATLAARARSG